MVSLLDDVQGKKPHLRVKDGIWSCTTPVGGRFRIGLGYSPETAWKDWEGMTLLCGPMGAAVWTGLSVAEAVRIPVGEKKHG